MKVKVLLILLICAGFGQQIVAQDFQAQRSSATIMENGQKYYVHQVEKGNTLYNISKTYGVSSSIIREENPDLKDGLKLGMELKIPYHLAQSTDFIYHIVKKKETLYQISKIYNVKVEDITSINEISNEEISEGQYLKIPSMFVESNSENLFTEASAANVKIDDDKYKVYKVQPKETLFAIGKRFGISVDALMYLNDLSDANLQTGQSLLIPKKLFHKTTNTIDSSAFIQHKVKAKETLYGLAKLYAISMDDILKNNEIVDNQLRNGQLILIPRDLNETGFIQHKVVERREKLSKIAGEYNVSLLEVKNANPNLKEKLKKGQSVLIPIGYVEADFDQIIEEDVDEEPIVTEEPKDKEKTKCKQWEHQTAKYKVALMIPLYLEELDSLNSAQPAEMMESRYNNSFKFIEFYEGALLAARELHAAGLDFELSVYDVPRNEDSTAKVLLNPELKEMDLIISLLYSGSFELVNQFSKNHQIPVVNVLSKRRKIIFDNPFAIKIEPNEDFLYDKIIQYVLDTYQQKNIIIVRSNPYQLSDEYLQLKAGLEKRIPYLVNIPHTDVLYKVSKYELDYAEAEEKIDYPVLATQELRNQLPNFDYDRIQALPEDTLVIPNRLHTVVYSQDSLRGITDVSSLFRDNLILALGNEEVYAIELFTKLNFVRDSFNYKVIGLPFWGAYDGVDVSYTQPLDFQVVSNSFIDYSNPSVKDFVLEFRRQFGIEPQKERYAFLGFDVMKYFLSALQQFGPDFQECINEVDTHLLENDFRFEKIPAAGYENTHWNILMQRHYRYLLIE